MHSTVTCFAFHLYCIIIDRFFPDKKKSFSPLVASIFIIFVVFLKYFFVINDFLPRPMFIAFSSLLSVFFSIDLTKSVPNINVIVSMYQRIIFSSAIRERQSLPGSNEANYFD